MTGSHLGRLDIAAWSKQMGLISCYKFNISFGSFDLLALTSWSQVIECSALRALSLGCRDLYEECDVASAGLLTNLTKGFYAKEKNARGIYRIKKSRPGVAHSNTCRVIA